MPTSSVKFSALAGAHERQLQRKFHNPLFADAEQYLLPEEVEQARRKDQQDLQAFFTAFEDSLQQAAKLTGSVDAEVVLELKQELERLYVHSTSLGGDLGQHRDALRKLIQVCMNTITKGASDDVIALQKLEQESQAREVFFNLLNTPLVADLIRGDEIVTAHELIPTLLSENENNLSQVLELFDEQQIEQIIDATREFIQNLSPQVVETSQCGQRLAQIEGYID
jgi:hypothetical protein